MTSPTKAPAGADRRAELAVAPGSSQEVRAFARTTCAGWGLSGATAASAADIASELVSNGARCASAPVLLTLEHRPHELVVSAWDDDTGRPHVLPYRPGVSRRGLGLRLVAQLSDEWGWTEVQVGKWVWARLLLRTAGEPAALRRRRGPDAGRPTVVVLPAAAAGPPQQRVQRP